MFRQNFDKIILVALLIFYIFLQSNFFLLDPPVWLDEAYLADVAYNILNEGRVGTDIWGETIVGIKNSFYWYPPVFINTLALWFKVFGFSIINQRLLSLSLSVIFLVTVYFLISKQGKWFSLVLILFLILDNTFLKVAKMGRTEMTAVTLGFLSLLSYQIAQNTKFKKMLIISGLLLGLTAMTHLLDLFFFITVLISIIFTQRRFFADKVFYQFLLAFLIPILIWLISIFPNYSILKSQLSLQGEFRNLVPSHIESVFKYSSPEQKTVYVIYILLSFFAILSFTWERGKYAYLVVGLLISWLICLFGKLEWYVIYIVSFLYPFVFMQVIKKRSVLSHLLLILAAALLVFNIKVYLNQYSNFKDNKDAYFQFGELVKSKIPEDKVVYLSTSPDLYFIFKGRNHIFEFPAIGTQVDEYKKLLNQSHYIVINSRLDHLFVGNLLDKYIALNKMNEVEAGNNLYRAKIIELVPTEQRRLPL